MKQTHTRAKISPVKKILYIKERNGAKFFNVCRRRRLFTRQNFFLAFYFFVFYLRRHKRTHTYKQELPLKMQLQLQPVPGQQRAQSKKKYIKTGFFLIFTHMHTHSICCYLFDTENFYYIYFFNISFYFADFILYSFADRVVASY